MITVAQISDLVGRHYSLKPADLKQGRVAYRCDARAVVYGLAREYTTASLPEIGRFFARDHTTVLTGLKRFEKMEQDQRHAVSISEIRSAITGKVAVFKSVRASQCVHS